MSAEITFDSQLFVDDIKKRMDVASDKALSRSADLMLNRMDVAFDHEGQRPGVTKLWEPTSLIALLRRVTAPKTGTFAQRIGQIAASNPKTLVDTEFFRRSFKILDVIKQGFKKVFFAGASDPKILKHEEGGVINIKGQSFDNPARPNQFITELDQKDILEITKFELENA